MPSSWSPTVSASTLPQGIGARGRKLRTDWWARFEKYKAKYPKEADALDRMQRRLLPDGWDKNLPTFPADAKGMRRA